MPSSIVILTSAHPTDDKRVYHKFARSFVRAGWDVSWFGVDLSTPGSVLSRDVDWHLSPPPETRVQRLKSLPQLLGATRGLRHTGGWVYCPDPDAMAVAIPSARRMGAKLVFDIHELFHETHMSKWAGGRAHRPASEAVRRSIRAAAARADIVSSPSPGVLDAYLPENRSGLLLRNTVPRSFADEAESARTNIPSGPPVIMAGIPGGPRGTPEIARALALVDSMFGIELRALVLGDEQGLRTALDTSEPGLWARTARYFVIAEPVPHEQMPASLSGCIAGIIGYTGAMAGPNLGNRTFEYMAAGIPVLAPTQSPLIAEIINTHGCGLTYSNNDVSSLAHAMARIAQDPPSARVMGQAGRDAFLSSYSWDAEFERLLDRMSELDRGVM